MARLYEDLRAPEPTGPFDCVIASASVTLAADEQEPSPQPWPMRSCLVSFATDPDSLQRLRATNAQVARGVQEARSLPAIDWARHLDAQPPAAHTGMVIAVPARRRRCLAAQLPGLLAQGLARPLVIVTDDPAALHDLGGVGPFGIVKAAADDLLGTAMAVHRMMLCLIAPSTYACTDVEDVEAVFREGPYARVCVAAWSPESGLVFGSPQDKGLVEGAKGVLAQIDYEKFGSLRATKSIFDEVRALCRPDATAMMLAANGMFVRCEPAGGLQRVPLLCTGTV